MALSGPGALAFVGFNASDNDDFAVLVTEDIPAGETIYFTDNAWDGSSFAASEGVVTWTVTTAIPAGTVVNFNSTNSSGTITVSTGTVSGEMSLATVNENIFAYQGPDAATPSTFLAAIANDDFSAATSVLTNTGLTVGTTAIELDVIDPDADIAAYNAIRTFSSVSEALSIVNDTSSWVTQDTGAAGQSSDGTDPDVPFDDTVFSLCFGAGTGIATPTGEVAVETLEIGDLVCTADGGAVPVRWIGRQTIQKRFWRERACLVRISAGTLGNHSDLYVTADHGMVLDGFVINAGVLVNGKSIDMVPLSETPDVRLVYHVETEAHDVILANGAAAETFLDMPGRRAFDNFGEYRALYGEERTIDEMSAPRITSARLLPGSIRARLGMRKTA